MTMISDHEMSQQSRYTRAIILGGGYSARLTACALTPVMPINKMIGKLEQCADVTGPESMTGQRSHSHIFLPRLEQELTRIDPSFAALFAERGLWFQPGSKRLGDRVPQGCRRLFATRWQFDGAIDALFQRSVGSKGVTPIDAGVRGFHMDPQQCAIHAIDFVGDGRLDIAPDTLVIDAMGAKSPIMQNLAKGDKGAEDLSSQITYLTQFFRLTSAQASQLPDALTECSRGFGAVYMMLYPAAQGWFSVSLAVNSARKDLVRRFRDPAAFLDFCRQNQATATWVDAAEPGGALRMFVNPRNRWNVDIFARQTTPRNYIAVGDALVTMTPTRGANCSFSATHIRILRDLLTSGQTDLQRAFADAVRNEQRTFFESTLGEHLGDELITRASAPWGPLKRVKAVIKQILGIDRTRIAETLERSSSI